MIVLPVINAPMKPAFGESCNGCGFCCATETCQLARTLMGAMIAPCPAMEFEDNRFWCGLVRNPAKHLGLREWQAETLRESFSNLLGIGYGCDSSFNHDEKVEVPGA